MRLCEPLLSNRTPPERFTRHPRPRQCGVLSSLGFENVRLILYFRQLSDGPPVSCLVGGAASRLLFFQPECQFADEVHLKIWRGGLRSFESESVSDDKMPLLPYLH